MLKASSLLNPKRSATIVAHAIITGARLTMTDLVFSTLIVLELQHFKLELHIVPLRPMSRRTADRCIGWSRPAAPQRAFHPFLCASVYSFSVISTWKNYQKQGIPFNGPHFLSDSDIRKIGWLCGRTLSFTLMFPLAWSSTWYIPCFA